MTIIIIIIITITYHHHHFTYYQHHSEFYLESHLISSSFDVVVKAKKLAEAGVGVRAARKACGLGHRVRSGSSEIKLVVVFFNGTVCSHLHVNLCSRFNIF
jgi:hypothetical protein